MADKEIAYILRKYFKILILTFLLFSSFFLVLFSISIHYLKDMPQEEFIFHSFLLYVFYSVGVIFITDMLLEDKKSKDKKKEEEEKWK